MKKSILMLVLGIGMSTFAFAQNRNTTQGVDRSKQTQKMGTTDTGNSMDMYNDRDNDWNNSAYTEELELDENQRTRFDDLRIRRQNEMKELDERYNEPLSNYRNERSELDSRYDDEFKEILNEEQQNKYDTEMKERHNRRKEMNNRDNGMNNRDNGMNNRDHDMNNRDKMNRRNADDMNRAK